MPCCEQADEKNKREGAWNETDMVGRKALGRRTVQVWRKAVDMHTMMVDVASTITLVCDIQHAVSKLGHAVHANNLNGVALCP